MQHRKKHKKSTKPKTRSNRRDPPKVTIVRGPYLVPNRMRITLHYSAKGILNDNTSADANIRFRPSSIYDVDPTVGGSSYYGFTEMAAFYTKYKVISSSITVMGANRDGEASIVYVLPVTSDPGVNVADPARYYMNPLARKRTAAMYQATPVYRVTAHATTKSLSGVSTTADDNYTADVGANPTDNWYWFIGLRYIGASTMTYGVSYDVEIKTQVDLFDRKVLSDPAYLLPKPQPSIANPGPTFPPPIPVYNVPPPSSEFQDRGKINSNVVCRPSRDSLETTRPAQ